MTAGPRPVPPLQAVIIPVTALQQNCSLVWCTATMRGAVTDPGGDLELIRSAIRQHGVTVERILVTHGHVDHAAAVADLAAELGVPVEGPHIADKFLIDAMPDQGLRFGIMGAKAFTPDRWLEDGDTVTVGDLSFAVLHCPGHAPGHVVFHNAESRFALVGDVIFKGSVGRTDLPGGDTDTLIRSIREKLFPLGDDVTFLPGHGEPSTLGNERRSNPYVSDRALASGARW